jgi:hypothetical protein
MMPTRSGAPPVAEDTELPRASKLPKRTRLILSEAAAYENSILNSDGYRNIRPIGTARSEKETFEDERILAGKRRVLEGVARMRAIREQILRVQQARDAQDAKKAHQAKEAEEREREEMAMREWRTRVWVVKMQTLFVNGGLLEQWD